jgi:CMP-N-acetylneuraminic acid synthetase
MEAKTITALVPMRHHSQRIPGKNYRVLAGRPLYQHVLSNLLQVKELTQIVVDTDSDEIIAGVEANFPNVKILRRPDYLRADNISMNEILLNAIESFPQTFIYRRTAPIPWSRRRLSVQRSVL